MIFALAVVVMVLASIEDAVYLRRVKAASTDLRYRGLFPNPEIRY